MRTLHLLRGSCSPHADEPSFSSFEDMVACGRAIARETGEPQRVVLVGDQRAARDAALAGLRVDRRVHPPLGIDRLAWSALRRERAWNADRVRVWSPGLEPIARRAALGRIEAAPPAAAPPVDDWRRRNQDSGGAIAHADRASLRAWLGAGPADRVIALLADPPAHGDARRFAFVLGLLEVGIGPVVGVMSAVSSQTPRGRRFHRLAVRRSPLLAVEGSIIPWLLVADAALLEGPDDQASRSAAATAIGLGVPLVAPDWLLPGHAGNKRVYPTDGRTRTLLPALLKALEHPHRANSQQSNA